MGSFRQKMREARQTLHDEMSVPAICFTDLSDESTWKTVSVRVHDFYNAIGDLKGTNFNFAEVRENSPSIIFLRSEISHFPRAMIVSVEPGVAYRLGAVDPRDDITIKVFASRIPEKETEGFPIPGDTLDPSAFS